MRKKAYPLKSAALLLTLLVALLALAACGNTANSRVAGSEREIIYGYILEINQQARTVMVDEAELLTLADTDRISRLGLREDMFQDGYYVYNRAVERRLYALPDTAEVDLSALRQDSVTDMTDGAADSRSNDMTDNLTGSTANGITDNTTGSTANGMADNTTGSTANGMADNTTNSTANGMADNTTGSTANGMADNTTDNRTNDRADSTANSGTERDTDRDTLGEDLRDAASRAADSIADLLDLQREHPQQLYALTIENDRVVAIRAAGIATAADNR